MRLCIDAGEENGGLHEKAETEEGEGDMSGKWKPTAGDMLLVVIGAVVIMMAVWGVMELLYGVAETYK